MAQVLHSDAQDYFAGHMAQVLHSDAQDYFSGHVAQVQEIIDHRVRTIFVRELAQN
jgi:hypothetical protein